MVCICGISSTEREEKVAQNTESLSLSLFLFLFLPSSLFLSFKVHVEWSIFALSYKANHRPSIFMVL